AAARSKPRDALQRGHQIAVPADDVPPAWNRWSVDDRKGWSPATEQYRRLSARSSHASEGDGAPSERASEMPGRVVPGHLDHGAQARHIVQAAVRSSLPWNTPARRWRAGHRLVQGR